ncbi:MAG: S8 family serine peptidase [Flavobacteriaceae bacterium]|nr:S8 family serine peptidase [Flavobacteriaceae bacterium]
MKNLLFLLIPLFVFSQQRDPRSDQFNFVPGELIVKLKDDVDAGVVYASVGQAPAAVKLVVKNSISKEVSRIIGLEAAVKSQEVLFSKESVDNSIRLKQQKTLQRVQQQRQLQSNSSGGSTPPSATMDEPEEVLSLKNVVKLELEDKNANILELVEKLKDNPNIEYIEPNYIYSINDFEIASDIIYNKDLSPVSTTSTTVPDDPLYSQQTNITQTNIDDVWNEYTTGDGSQIVAILDTGVDYTHPDLEANIWINEAELNGVEGFDDDGNGYVDDIRGWDFINNDNAPLDDNMHGTHVAGIVGAVGGNGIGVAGAAWNVKLMPIKVFQSNGYGTMTDIVNGINYALSNGSNIINMSFGSYAFSTTLFTTLQTAYGTNFLVASSGNDGFLITRPSWPAAISFVFGIQDSDGIYDNYDPDGPFFSTMYGGHPNYPQATGFLNYELNSPGTKILSTVPNGGYRKLTGTSMSAPLVTGSVALYKQIKQSESNDKIFSQLINTSENNFNLKAALEENVGAIFKIQTTENVDENNNYLIEPGEIIDIYPVINNFGEPIEDIKVSIELGEFEDSSKVEIINNQVSINSLGTYTHIKSDNPLKIKIDENVSNNNYIRFKINVWHENDLSDLESLNFEILVEKKSILSGTIEDTTITLEEDSYYYINEGLVLKNSHLILEPGVTLEIFPQAQIYMSGDFATIKSLGTKEKNNLIFANENVQFPLQRLLHDSTLDPSYFKFTTLRNIISDYSTRQRGLYYLSHKPVFENCIIDEFTFLGEGSIIRNSNFFPTPNRIAYYFWFGTSDQFTVEYNNVYYDGSTLDQRLAHVLGKNNRISFKLVEGGFKQIEGNNGYVRNQDQKLGDIYEGEHRSAYFGSSSIDKLKEIFTDIFTGGYGGWWDWTNSVPRLEPYSEAPGIVWKVLVNGKDALDEYDEMDPIGVGTHEFKVYFNREMDTNINPEISYGPREPFNQKIIKEIGTWSSDGKIYTVTHDINLGIHDGINKIRVAEARDLNYMKILVEDTRFNMLVQSAGSASTGFMATAGLGEITLDWTAPSESDLDDVLGYNMYRYTANEDGTFTDPVKINESLITDITFKDYDVARDTQYFYKYKILRTSFEETDYSNAVSSQLLTAALGDSNGDSSVNVMDVVNTVDYILGNNPTPFVDYATDVNNDSSVNVLDVVGIVDMILNPTTSSVRLNGEPINYVSNTPVGEAELFWRDNDLYVKTDKPISGLQLSFNGDLSFTASELLEGYELNNFMIDDKRVVMAYSFEGFQITPGTHKLLSTSNKPLDVTAGAMATSYGESIFVLYNQGAISHIDAPLQTDKLEVLSVSPNPSNGLIKLHFYLPEQMDNLSVGVFDLSGRLMWNSSSFKNTKGHARASLDLQKLSTGTYIMMINANRSGETKFNHTTKIVIE